MPILQVQNDPGSDDVADVPQVSETPVLFDSGASAEWGETCDPVVTSPELPPMLSAEDIGLVDVPSALTHLEGIGFRFQHVPEEN